MLTWKKVKYRCLRAVFFFLFFFSRCWSTSEFRPISIFFTSFCSQQSESSYFSRYSGYRPALLLWSAYALFFGSQTKILCYLCWSCLAIMPAHCHFNLARSVITFIIPGLLQILPFRTLSLRDIPSMVLSIALYVVCNLSGDWGCEHWQYTGFK